MSSIEEARRAALEVLLHNARNGRYALPRTAGWGYPEPYTRDLMISALGILVTGNEELVESLRHTLLVAAENQSAHGQIPGLVGNPRDRGSSDTTPLFLIALALFRQTSGEPNFLEEATRKALTRMGYQSPDDRGLVAQQPTSDWRDEQWVLGYGLYVNVLVYMYLRLLGFDDQARLLKERINQPVIVGGEKPAHVQEGLVIPDQPHYALWSYKVHYSERFDLLGNSLAILTGIASPAKSRSILDWIESQCADLRSEGDLAVGLPPCLWPFIKPDHRDWHPRYERFNRPGTYHNGGIWPFICGLHVAVLVAAGYHELAEHKLAALTELIRPARRAHMALGFNEWFQAQTGQPCGEDWQTWSAALYLYAALAVEENKTPFFDAVRTDGDNPYVK